MRHIIGILLQNESGALSRVAAMFSSRGYNIESLSVSATDDPAVSRITLVTQGSDAVVQQIVNQLHKLIDIVAVDDMTTDDHLERELALIKIRARSAQRPAIQHLLEQAGGRVLSEERDCLILEITSSEAAISELARNLSGQAELLEIVRSGALAMLRREPEPVIRLVVRFQFDGDHTVECRITKDAKLRGQIFDYLQAKGWAMQPCVQNAVRQPMGLPPSLAQ